MIEKSVAVLLLAETGMEEQVALATETTRMLIQSSKLDFCGQPGSFAQTFPADEPPLPLVRYLQRCRKEIQYRSRVTLCGLNRERQGYVLYLPSLIISYPLSSVYLFVASDGLNNRSRRHKLGPHTKGVGNNSHDHLGIRLMPVSTSTAHQVWVGYIRRWFTWS